MTAITDRQKLQYIAAQAADARVNVELEAEGMTLNIGPQHPATHGTLRIVARLDGEQVIAAEPIPGYMHRGYEKLCEVRTYPQVTTLINRIDWLGSFANEVPFGHARTAAYMAFGLCDVADLMEHGKWAEAEALTLLLLTAVEQAALQEWQWGLAWLPTFSSEPPWARIRAHPPAPSDCEPSAT